MPRNTTSRRLKDELQGILEGNFSRKASEALDWAEIYDVLPVCHFPEPFGMTNNRRGFVHIRHRETGFRWSVNVFEGEDYVFARHSVYQGKNGHFLSTVYFDTEADSRLLLDWALEVWENAVRDGDGDLPFVPVTAPKELFHAVSGDRRLICNAWGKYPWSPTVGSSGAALFRPLREGNGATGGDP